MDAGGPAGGPARALPAPELSTVLARLHGMLLEPAAATAAAATAAVAQPVRLAAGHADDPRRQQAPE